MNKCKSNLKGGSHEKKDKEIKEIFDEINKVNIAIVGIGVAGGKEKVESILGAINGKYINILVSNYSCCKELLKS